MRKWSREDRHTVGALIFLIVVVVLISLRSAFSATPPLGYIAVGFQYQSGQLIGAKVLGVASSLEGCLKAAQGAVGEFFSSPHDPNSSVNVGCMHVPLPIVYRDPKAPDLTKPSTTL